MSRKSRLKSKPRPENRINEIIKDIKEDNTNFKPKDEYTAEEDNPDSKGEVGYTSKEISGGVLRDIDSPTLVVEGPNDVTIYRWIVEEYLQPPIALVPAGSRSTVEKLYKDVNADRHNYPLVPIAFIADQDMDVFSSPPSGYEDIIWTKGYSIENDLYTYGESVLRGLLKKHERKLYQTVLETIIEWFAFEVEQYNMGKPNKIAASLNRVVPKGPDAPPTQTVMDRKFSKTRDLNPPRPFRRPNETTYKEVKDGHRRKIRGKHLFDLLIRYLNYESREPLYGRVHLWDRAFRAPDSDKWKTELVKKIKEKMNKDRDRIRKLGRRTP